jgi:hypothetical protein
MHEYDERRMLDAFWLKQQSREGQVAAFEVRRRLSHRDCAPHVSIRAIAVVHAAISASDLRGGVGELSALT